MKISVVGLGKLGAPLSAVMASKGFTVVGIDLNQDFVDALNAGRAPVDEPQLQDLIDTSRARLHATDDFHDAIAASDVTFVIVPTSFTVRVAIPKGRQPQSVGVAAPENPTPALQPLDFTTADGEISFRLDLHQYAIVVVAWA